MKMDRGIARFDINDPADMKRLVASGIIWKGGPMAVRAAINYLKDYPSEANDKVPEQVRAMLEAKAPVPSEMPVEPAPEAETPVEDASPTEEPGDTPPTA